MSPSKVEERLSRLEAEVTQLKRSLLNSADTVKPWWDNIVGVFADDPNFEEAIAIGREYRQSYKDLFEPSEVGNIANLQMEDWTS
jgi:phage-related minor tail protein